MENKQHWYDKISDSFELLMRKFDMPEDMQIEIREFVFGVAREQFRVGNKSGISWAYRKVRDEQGASAPAAA